MCIKRGIALLNTILKHSIIQIAKHAPISVNALKILKPMARVVSRLVIGGSDDGGIPVTVTETTQKKIQQIFDGCNRQLLSGLNKDSIGQIKYFAKMDSKLRH